LLKFVRILIMATWSRRSCFFEWTNCFLLYLWWIHFTA